MAMLFPSFSLNIHRGLICGELPCPGVLGQLGVVFLSDSSGSISTSSAAPGEPGTQLWRPRGLLPLLTRWPWPGTPKAWDWDWDCEW